MKTREQMIEAAEQKRVLEALEVEKRIANYGGTNYRSIAQKAMDTAIEIVKGGEK